MVQIGYNGDNKGTFITETDYKSAQLVTHNGRQMYFIPHKQVRDTMVPIDMALIEQMILDNVSKEDIVKQTRIKIGRINNHLTKHYGTSVLCKIRSNLASNIK